MCKFSTIRARILLHNSVISNLITYTHIYVYPLEKRNGCQRIPLYPLSKNNIFFQLLLSNVRSIVSPITLEIPFIIADGIRLGKSPCNRFLPLERRKGCASHVRNQPTFFFHPRVIHEPGQNSRRRSGGRRIFFTPEVVIASPLKFHTSHHPPCLFERRPRNTDNTEKSGVNFASLSPPRF